MNLLKKLSPLIAASLVPVMTLNVGCDREEEFTFKDWDKNNNNKIELDKFFNTFIPNYYDDWNTTDNDYLDDEDFYQVPFVLWDTDNDNHLSEEEYMMGYTVSMMS